jgi:hypothetical protein
MAETRKHLGRAAIVTVTFGALVLGIGCAGSSGAGGLPDAGHFGPVCTPGSVFDLNGRSGVLATLSVHVNASGLVETDTTAELLLLLDINQSGRTIGVNAKVCDIKIPEVPISGQDMPIRFQLGDGLLDSVARVTGTGHLDGDSTCANFSSDPITVVIGARLDPPDQGKLPEANSAGEFTQCLPAGAPCAAAITNQCVCDQENDGHPGATLLAFNVPAITIKDVYVNLRTTFSLSGQVFSSDEIQGDIHATLEQGILACSKASGAPCSSMEIGAVKNLNPDIQQNDEPSTFRSVRVDDALDCATLLQMKDALFPR